MRHRGSHPMTGMSLKIACASLTKMNHFCGEFVCFCHIVWFEILWNKPKFSQVIVGGCISSSQLFFAKPSRSWFNMVPYQKAFGGVSLWWILSCICGMTCCHVYIMLPFLPIFSKCMNILCNDCVFSDFGLHPTYCSSRNSSETLQGSVGNNLTILCPKICHCLFFQTETL